eukprot:5268572-Prymnesium_polylepis.2
MPCGVLVCTRKCRCACCWSVWREADGGGACVAGSASSCEPDGLGAAGGSGRARRSAHMGES